MSLDPALKTRIENWFNGPLRSKPLCPGCKEPSRSYEAMGLSSSPKAVALACESCGYAYVFLLDRLKNYVLGERP
jgi:hypothetical protein